MIYSKGKTVFYKNHIFYQTKQSESQFTDFDAQTQTQTSNFTKKTQPQLTSNSPMTKARSFQNKINAYNTQTIPFRDCPTKSFQNITNSMEAFQIKLTDSPIRSFQKTNNNTQKSLDYSFVFKQKMPETNLIFQKTSNQQNSIVPQTTQMLDEYLQFLNSKNQYEESNKKIWDHAFHSHKVTKLPIKNVISHDKIVKQRILKQLNHLNIKQEESQQLSPLAQSRRASINSQLKQNLGLFLLKKRKIISKNVSNDFKHQQQQNAINEVQEQFRTIVHSIYSGIAQLYEYQNKSNLYRKIFDVMKYKHYIIDPFIDRAHKKMKPLPSEQSFIQQLTDEQVFLQLKPDLDEIRDTITAQIELIGNDNIIIQKFIIKDLLFFNEWLEKQVMNKDSNELSVIKNNVLYSRQQFITLKNLHLNNISECKIDKKMKGLQIQELSINNQTFQNELLQKLQSAEERSGGFKVLKNIDKQYAHLIENVIENLKTELNK